MRKAFYIANVLLLTAPLMMLGCASKSTFLDLKNERAQAGAKASGNVGTVVNTATDDYAPKFIGNTLVYSSGISVRDKYPKSLQAELCTADHQAPMSDGAVNQGWQPVQLLGTRPFEGVPLDLNEGAFDVLPEKHYAVFAAERIVGGTGQSALLDLYEVQVDDKFHATSTPQPIAAVNDPDAWDSQPALSSDGNTLFFASDRPIRSNAERGNQHIWHSERTSDGWSKPKLLPKPYTTKGNDVTPFVGPDGYFYYSSDGNPDGEVAPAGMGGRDIFRVKMQDGQLKGDPERLPAPFNSPKDDDFPFVTKDRRSLWLASDRDSGCGKRDIYTFPIPIQIHLAGKVTQAIETDSGFGAPAGVAMTLWIDDRTTKRHYNIETNNIGEYEVALKPDHQYTVSVADSGCNQSAGVTEVNAVAPYGWDTTHVRDFYLERHSVSITLGKNSDVPFFITGFWRPNTTKNLAEFKQRRLNDPAFAKLIYIGPNDYDYDAGSHEVDRIFEQEVYRPILDSILPLLNNPCYDSNYIMHLNVDGYTDKDPIKTDKYLDQDVIGGEIDIHNGDLMDGPEAGNKKLSILRAYYAMVDLQSHLMTNAKFADYYNRKRIKITFRGHGIDKTLKPNLGFNRRVDVTAEIERR